MVINFMDITAQIGDRTPRQICLSQNKLARTPAGLPFKLLIVLNISLNRIETLHGIKKCESLLFLNASLNQIKKVTEVPPKIRELFLSHNQITSFELAKV